MVFPTLFVSHGSPTLALENSVTHSFLRGLGTTLPAPEAILCVSAHWETAAPSVSAALQPATIHDFGGFPEPLYQLRYPAPGSEALARRTAALMEDAGVTAHVDPDRGLDHGVWVPLLLMYPEAQVPVVSLSVQSHLSPADHYRVGEALSPLREAGVLIVGSGGATHDLRAFWGQPREAPPKAYATAFDDWLVDCVERGDARAMLEYETTGPEAQRNHPTPEHFLPLFAPLGAARGAPGRVLHRAMEHGVLAMTAFLWE